MDSGLHTCTCRNTGFLSPSLGHDTKQDVYEFVYFHMGRGHPFWCMVFSKWKCLVCVVALWQAFLAHTKKTHFRYIGQTYLFPIFQNEQPLGWKPPTLIRTLFIWEKHTQKWMTPKLITSMATTNFLLSIPCPIDVGWGIRPLRRRAFLVCIYHNLRQISESSSDFRLLKVSTWFAIFKHSCNWWKFDSNLIPTKEGPLTFACKSFWQDWQDWHI